MSPSRCAGTKSSSNGKTVNVCTIYQLDVETDSGATTVLVSEWSTVRGGQIASSLMVFDTGPFPRAGQRL